MNRLLIAILLFIMNVFTQQIGYAEWQNIAFEKKQLVALEDEFKERKNDLNAFMSIKYALINGEIHTAKKMLKNLQINNSKLEVILYYYKAIIAFIENDFAGAMKFLGKISQKNFGHYQQTCFFNLLIRILNQKTDHIQDDFLTCSTSTAHHSTNEHLWFYIIVNMINKDEFLFQKNGLSRLFNNFDDLSDEVLTIWLKSALYFNKENEIENIVKYIPSSAYKNPQVRELLGFMYYRIGNFELARELMADLDTPNAENVQGAILLSEQKIELAYGHFQLALQKKQNSLNAVERLAPLAYPFEDFLNGITYIKKLPFNDKNEFDKMTLQSGFQYKVGQYEEVNKNLEQIAKYYQGLLPKKVHILASLNALALKDQEKLLSNAEAACLQYSPLQCMLLSDTLTWPDLPNMMVQNTRLTDIQGESISSDPNFSIEKLKEKPTIKALDEAVYIDQTDVIELDDKDYDLSLNHEL